MRIEFVTLFPRQVEMLADFGVVGRAVERGLLELGTVDPRELPPMRIARWTTGLTAAARGW